MESKQTKSTDKDAGAGLSFRESAETKPVNLGMDQKGRHPAGVPQETVKTDRGTFQIK